jgi:hypothetical protein
MMGRTANLLFLLPLPVSAFAVANKQVAGSQLLERHAAEIDRLKEKTGQTVSIKNKAQILSSF